MNVSKRALWRFILSIVLTAYLFTAVALSRNAAAEAPFNGIDIAVNDSLDTHFITADDVYAITSNLTSGIDTVARGKVNTLLIERELRKSDRIEQARCIVLNNGVLKIEVVPMIPVARVFPLKGKSFYVNAQGKRIEATVTHHIDVPVISGNITSPEQVTPMLPMLAHIRANAELDAWASSINLDNNGDIIIIPAVLGHSVTIGDTSMIADKFARLKQFYREVMPVKGWNYYNNISVKWRGRVVATRRDKVPSGNVPLTQLDGIIDEVEAPEVMLTTGDDIARTP